jgi:hypothetical protein
VSRTHALFVAAALLFTSSPAAAEPSLADAAPSLAAEVRAGHPLVTYVVVPLCDSDQINCGSAVAGRPADLEHNLYWGAQFGARRFFERKNSGWERVEITRKDAVFLERAVYRRFVPGAPWGRSEPVEQIVAFQAIHGASIDEAVDHFHRIATEGGRLSFRDGDKARDEAIQIAGYEGHNRLMDGKKLPEPAKAARSPVPSFVLACESEPYFAPSLVKAGSLPLVTTATLMAPEAYLVDAIVRGIGENAPAVELRARAVATYAKWQRLSHKQASSVFARPAR